MDIEARYIMNSVAQQMKSVQPRVYLLYIGLCMLLLVSCSRPDQGNHWKTIDLENGSLEVRYQDAFGFGPHTVFFYLHRDERIRYLGKTSLHNDGANLGDHNLGVVGLGNGRWRVILSGQEQADEHWLIETDDGHAGMERVK